MDEYGHRESTLTVSQPAWKDEPEAVLGILKVLAGVERKRADQTRKWQERRDRLLRSSIVGRWPFRPLFLRWLGEARALFQIREDTHFYATMLQPPIRHAVLEMGRQLREAGALEQASDVFHLQLDDLEKLGEPGALTQSDMKQIHELVSRRKAKRESLSDKPMFDPRLMAADTNAPMSGKVILRGSSGSPGNASGPARILHDSSEFGKLRAGDVLVAPVTNPAWTPLFQRAAAVVVDTGGAASHAAIVAREYGIPAVMGTVHGTIELKDGQRIEVDGSRGVVSLAEESQ